MGPLPWSRDQTRVQPWKYKGSPSPKKFRAKISQKNHGNSFFGFRRCSAFGIHAIQDNHYWRHLCFHKAFVENIKHKRRGKLSAGVLLLHDNAPAHNSRTSRAAIRKCGFVELNHPPYSPELTPCDYLLFRNLKSFLRGRRFIDGNAVKEALTVYFDNQEV